MYGSATGTLAEVEALVPPSTRTSPRQLSAQAVTSSVTTPVDVCRVFHPEDFNVNLKQFPPSSQECFMEKVNRAIALQRELRAFLICDVMEPLAGVLAWNRQRQMFGLPDNSFTIISNAVSGICPIYEQKIQPYWAEAQANCALSIVLMQFMLGFERQVQILGMTNLADCNYTLFSNQDKLCKAAEGCLRETQGCCHLGHRGQQKFLEVFNILKQFESVGDTSCFPAQMDDPLVREVLEVCLTNAWYGTYQARSFGRYTRTTSSSSTETTSSQELDSTFNGSVFSSDERPNIPLRPRRFSMIILGTGTAKD
jgi:hypothetical protein